MERCLALITDPVETVGKIDSPFAVVIGAMTFTIATIGINIVANFVSGFRLFQCRSQPHQLSDRRNDSRRFSLYYALECKFLSRE